MAAAHEQLDYAGEPMEPGEFRDPQEEVEAMRLALERIAELAQPLTAQGEERIWRPANEIWELATNFNKARAARTMDDAPDACPTCGATKPTENEYCSDGFHAPGETYWPVDAPDARPDVVERVFKVLRDWRLGTMAQEDEPSEGYPLVDAVSTPGGTVATGEEELGEIAAEIVAALSQPKGEVEAMLRSFAETVPENAGGKCPWCLGTDHWSGRVELCPSPSSQAVAAALAPKERSK
jgi:hypothetical protein